MEEAGAELAQHYRAGAFMGFVEVLLHLRSIFRNIRSCKEDIARYQPDVVIFIDYPGFNLRIAPWAKEQGFKTIYYIAPQAWAWKKDRAHLLRRVVDQLLVILPFEQEFFEGYRVPTQFVGHPLLDAMAERPAFQREERLQSWGLPTDAPVVALLPGSRQQEIKAMLPLMAKAALEQNCSPVVAGAPSQDPALYRELLRDFPQVQLLQGQTYELLEVADAALVTSGTATLEAALFAVPEVVCYRGNWISYQIARRLVQVSYISLVNLVMDRPVVTELIQNELSLDRLSQELAACLSPEARPAIQEDYRLLRQKLGGAGASERAASAILQVIAQP